MGKRILFFFIGFLFLFLFASFSFIVKKDLLISFDFDTTVRIQNHIPLRLDSIFSILGFTANFYVITVVLFIFVILKRQFRGFLVLSLYGFAHFVELVGKLYLDHPGPPFMFYRLREPEFLFPGSYVTGSSYPSGHSLRAYFLAIIIAYLVTRLTKNKFVTFLLLLGTTLCFASILALGKVILGHHWPSDTIGGAMIGLSFGFFTVAIYQPLSRKKP